MGPLRVTTWNVLHRVHAANWGEAPVALFPDERDRIARISEIVASWFASGVDAVCLQEVSGDQVVSLRGAIGEVAVVFTHAYPRLPRVRRGSVDLVDATEHLVTIAKAPARAFAARTFDADPGKGMLGVFVRDDVLLIDTHVSFGERRGAQLAAIAKVARGAARTAIVVGDFNAPADVVHGALGEGFAISRVDRPTRIATDVHDGRTIDHVVVLNGALAGVAVQDCGGLSDHHPVTATVVLAIR